MSPGSWILSHRRFSNSWCFQPIVLVPISHTNSDWQLHHCCGNQWHPEAGVAHLVQCVRSARPLHQPACRELQLLLRAGIHRHLLPREWVTIGHSDRLYLPPLQTHMAVVVFQTLIIRLIIRLIMSLAKRGGKREQSSKDFPHPITFCLCSHRMFHRSSSNLSFFFQKIYFANQMIQKLYRCLPYVFLQTSMTVRPRPVRTEAPASMGSTPSSVSARTAGRAACAMPVSVSGRESNSSLHRCTGFREESREVTWFWENLAGGGGGRGMISSLKI